MTDEPLPQQTADDLDRLSVTPAGATLEPDPNQTEKERRGETRYEISVKDADQWHPLGVVDATSAKGAIKEWVEKNGTQGTDGESFTYQAVPVRNITTSVVTVVSRTVREVVFT